MKCSSCNEGTLVYISIVHEVNEITEQGIIKIKPLSSDVDSSRVECNSCGICSDYSEELRELWSMNGLEWEKEND